MGAKGESVALAYLRMLAERGVDQLFGNAGTDFAPMLVAYSEAQSRGIPVPSPVLAAHENLAVTMAHGYAMVSRRTPAVMVHVSVGTANMVCAAMNAARENIPLLLTAGRSPITEHGLPGARDGYIHWAQEMYDQAGLIREFVKWDYELRNGEQLASVVDRALAIARAEPAGPVYLSLPREVIASGMPDDLPAQPTPMRPPAPPAPEPDALAEAAEMISRADAPLIVTANAGREPGAFEALGRLAARFALPVVQHKPRYLGMASSHPMNLGYDPSAVVGDADLIVAIETDVPWIPQHGAPKADCRVIQCGQDPLYTHIPVRGFRSDLALAGSTRATLAGLHAALEARTQDDAVARRRSRIGGQQDDLAARRARSLDKARTQVPIHPDWVSHCIDRVKPENTVVVNEYTLRLDFCRFEEPDSYFGSSSASGLGWGAGAALGAKLAAPDRPVIAVLGDGAYLFSNPVAVHHASALHGLPVLFVIVNNSMWNAVRESMIAMYPDSQTATNSPPPFVTLDRLPDFETVCEASGGHGERVERPEELPAALERALAVVASEGRQALINVIASSE